MKRKPLLVILLLTSLGAFGCGVTGSRQNRDFPPRIDRFLVNEFSHLNDLGQTLGQMGHNEWENTKNFPHNLAQTLYWILGG